MIRDSFGFHGFGTIIAIAQRSLAPHWGIIPLSGRIHLGKEPD